MRIAVIDLGTNTFHLLIAETDGTAFEIVYKSNSPVRLGEGRLNDNIIIEAAFQRGVDQLKQYSRTLKEYGVTNYRATGTSAIRSATNGKAFVEAVQAESGIEIEMISGAEEATLIYEGVKASGAITETSLIIDIGGGSTEFILCTEEKLIWKKSYDAGAARLMQKYFQSDPLSTADERLIHTHLNELFTDLKAVCQQHQPSVLIGSAGAFETFAGMLDSKLKLAGVKSTEINFKAYQILAKQFIKSTHEERMGMEGLIPLRVDMIVMAVLITNYVLAFSGINRIRLSTYDLKMGVLTMLLKSGLNNLSH